MKEWFRHLARVFMPVYQFESDKLKIIYAGYSPIKKSYYARLLLNKDYNQTFLGRYLYTDIPNLINRQNIDMAVTEISRVTFNHFRNCNGYILPVWATMRINIDRPESDIFNKSKTDFRDVIRRIRKYDLTYEISTDKKMFDFFNEKFYLPYMKNRHRDEAFIEDLDTMWKSYEHPRIMVVKEKGNIAGMTFMRVTEKILYLKRTGLIDGNEDYLSHGVIGAAYYFGILEGLKMGCKYVDLGGSRPFLNDGLTRHKKGIGGEFEVNLDPSKEYLWFGVNEKSPAAKEYLSRNPFMHLTKDFKLVRCNYGEQINNESL
jgi:hypothetical protein